MTISRNSTIDSTVIPIDLGDKDELSSTINTINSTINTIDNSNNLINSTNSTIDNLNSKTISNISIPGNNSINTYTLVKFNTNSQDKFDNS